LLWAHQQYVVLASLHPHMCSSKPPPPAQHLDPQSHIQQERLYRQGLSLYAHAGDTQHELYLVGMGTHL
jgi:hypothetical protein